MAEIKEVIKDFSTFKKGEVKSFSTEMCKKYATFLKEAPLKVVKKDKSKDQK